MYFEIFKVTRAGKVGYQWRLRVSGKIVARSGRSYRYPGEARDAAMTLKVTSAKAKIVEK